MKKVFNIIPFFAFLFCFSQVQTNQDLCDLKKVEYLKKFEELFGNRNFIDYNSLEKVILDNIPYEKFTAKYLAINFLGYKYGESDYIGNGLFYCAYSVEDLFKDCLVFDRSHLWKAENIKYFQKKLKKEIILLPEEQDFINNYKGISLKKGIFKNYKKYQYYPTFYPKEFKYIPYKSNKLTIYRNESNPLKEFDNTDILEIILENLSDKEVILKFLLNDENNNFSQKYKYVNNQWKLIETTKQN